MIKTWSEIVSGQFVNRWPRLSWASNRRDFEMNIAIAIHIYFVLGSIAILYCEAIKRHEKRLPVIFTSLALIALNASIYLI